MSDDPANRPTVRILPGRHKRARGGRPWVYSNEIVMDAAALALAPGTLVTLVAADGVALGGATFNPHSLIAARILSPAPDRAIDTDFLADRIGRARRLRDDLYAAPYYRLIHAEADGLGGLVVDRYGDVLVVQLNSAGMDRLRTEVLAALEVVVAPRRIVWRNDSAVRAVEGLEAVTEDAVADGPAPLELPEGGARFAVDPAAGQKTGWYYDQRENRAFMAGLAGGRRVLDLYCYGGGFAIGAAVAGAREVLGIDRSAEALTLAARSAALSGVEGRCEFRRAEAFAELARLAAAGTRFDMVIADPPAFVKSRKDLNAGLRGYRKLVRLAAGLVAAEGYLFVASCSHNVDEPRFAEAVRHGLRQAGRTARILRRAGAAPDHPVHPFLPETAYLKCEALQLD